MRKIYFTTKEEGLEQLKRIYLFESYTTEEIFANSLVEHYLESFEEGMSVDLIMSAIQLFRQWAHVLEIEDITEICSEINLVNENGVEFNEFQDYVFFDGTRVPNGTRVGIERLHQDQMQLELDKGILFA